jgi:hypothetical protein
VCLLAYNEGNRRIIFFKGRVDVMDWIEAIKKYKPCYEQEKIDKELTLKYIDMFDDLLKRENQLIHMTCSSLIFNKDKDKVLMVHHNIYNSWSWT